MRGGFGSRRGWSFWLWCRRGGRGARARPSSFNSGLESGARSDSERSVGSGSCVGVASTAWFRATRLAEARQRRPVLELPRGVPAFAQPAAFRRRPLATSTASRPPCSARRQPAVLLATHVYIVSTGWRRRPARRTSGTLSRRSRRPRTARRALGKVRHLIGTGLCLAGRAEAASRRGGGGRRGLLN